jgi:hypothetical protein
MIGARQVAASRIADRHPLTDAESAAAGDVDRRIVAAVAADAGCRDGGGTGRSAVVERLILRFILTPVGDF